MIDFKIFQNDLVELFEYSIKQEDKLDLSTYTQLFSKTVVYKANKTHICNTVACIAGYAPEVHPDRFEWVYECDTYNVSAAPCSIGSDWYGYDIVFAYQGLDSKCVEDLSIRDLTLSDIFDPNNVNCNLLEDVSVTDIEVATKRLEVIKEATSYDELSSLIECEYREWF